MSFTIQVRMKKLGKQRPNTLAPVPFVLEEKPGTVRELISALVSLGVDDYNARKDQGQLVPFLTKEEIADQAGRGKIAFGLQNGEDACKADAIANAIQCFEDGIYRIFVEETSSGDAPVSSGAHMPSGVHATELSVLDEAIPWTEHILFTFIRLTMLSGW